MDEPTLSDTELDQLLDAASTPQPVAGFEQRLMARLNQNNVIAFPVRKKPMSWLIGLPLAASLALGIWLGASNLDFTSNAVVSDNSDITTNSGFEDVIALIGDNQS